MKDDVDVLIVIEIMKLDRVVFWVTIEVISEKSWEERPSIGPLKTPWTPFPLLKVREPPCKDIRPDNCSPRNHFPKQPCIQEPHVP